MRIKGTSLDERQTGLGVGICGTSESGRSMAVDATGVLVVLIYRGLMKLSLKGELRPLSPRLRYARPAAAGYIGA